MKQKDIFLHGEGDAWFIRNSPALAKQELPESDPLLLEILGVEENLQRSKDEVKVLEIGCGPGLRLAWLKQHMGWDCHGVDPSNEAVKQAVSAGVGAHVGTADYLPFADNSFDILIFGFCLYLCDRDDLFKIAAEADRVLRNPGWLFLKDFYSPTPLAREHHHKAGIYSYKMDYKSLFVWNPDYSVYSHRIAHHSGNTFTDDRSEWTMALPIRPVGSLLKMFVPSFVKPP